MSTTKTRVDVGDVLYGFCGGYFGRDSYSDKEVEALGPDWCVAREVDSRRPVFALVSRYELVEFATPEAGA